jgi:hypothetical protein
MLLATHSIVGAFIGKEIDYPPLAFLFGIISHILLDAIPHADGPDDKPGQKETDPISFAQYALVAVDIAVGLIVFIYLNSEEELSSSAIWGAIGSILPDALDNVPFYSGKLRSIFSPMKLFHQFHARIQHIKLSVIAGLAVQYAIALFFLILLILV